jgi:hypothetical protein
MSLTMAFLSIHVLKAQTGMIYFILLLLLLLMLLLLFLKFL